MDESAATEESTLAEALIAQQSHPGARGELHLVPVGHTLIEYVATVEARFGEHLHDLGVVLDLLESAAEVTLKRGKKEQQERNLLVESGSSCSADDFPYHIVVLSTGGLLQVVGIIRLQALATSLDRHETLLDVGAGGERHAATRLPVRRAALVGVGCAFAI